MGTDGACGGAEEQTARTISAMRSAPAYFLCEWGVQNRVDWAAELDEYPRFRQAGHQNKAKKAD
jgi:hypothetical protein